MTMELEAGRNELAVFFLAQDQQSGQEVAKLLADFIREAQYSLDMALYDFRLEDSLKDIIVEALRERAAAGVVVRIAYDADKPDMPRLVEGQDPAPGGTGQFVQSLGFSWRRIGGDKLMHHKYVVRDAQAVWTGSTNLTDGGLTLQENNIIQLLSPQVAAYYAQDFDELWASGQIANSGDFDTRTIKLEYRGEPANVRLLFSPGRGRAIDYEVAQRIAQAQDRVRICSMLLNSGALLSALSELLDDAYVKVDGIYDRTQMEAVLTQWQTIRHNRWKIRAIEEIIEDARLVGKNSQPYQPDAPHDFMHNKILLVDDTVITGSYNFSRSAQLNAENILIIESRPLADEYSRYIDRLLERYGEG